MEVGVIRCNQAAKRRRLGIALAGAVCLAFGHSGARTAGAAATGGEAMTNWASDVITETASASGRDPVEANRVTLTVAGGPVVVQWSLGYDAFVNAPFQELGPKRVCWSHPDVRVARTRRRRDCALEARGPGPDSVRAGCGHGHRERPVRRPRSGLRAQDLCPQSVEQGSQDQRQHAHHDLRGALIAGRLPRPVSRWSAQDRRAI